ncbi:uncharacterized protein DUF4157 [Nitrosomonas nitrosa]|uniref:eCIS core domain-containing protein n=1 Tax=Nitrosomonas nitrosa TaxID=52442 RepID=UPI000D3173AC|nr:DUF4157 domain-containing protein [Nitrosomonas nitrosa]PTQ91924.1 uncharacterized protein DUF4157 [Nitrosomonas nitrosa]
MKVAKQVNQTTEGTREPFIQRQCSHCVEEENTPFISPSRVGRVQAKLIIGQPGDQYEREADQIADYVMRMPMERETRPLISRISHVQPNLQRLCTDCEDEIQRKPSDVLEREEELSDAALRPSESIVQRNGNGDKAATQTSSDLSNQLQRRQGRGERLPQDIQTEMENAFGTDFSGVRVHRDSEAVQMSQELNARAFTHGSDIYFNYGKYDPQSAQGRKLLGHELTHVVQQRAVTLRNVIQRQVGHWNSNCRQAAEFEARNCNRPNLSLRRRLGSQVHPEIQRRFRRNDHINNLTEITVPGGNECRFEGSSTSRIGRADLIKVISRGPRGGLILLRIAEIKPASGSELAGGEAQATCYANKIIRYGPDCLLLGILRLRQTSAFRQEFTEYAATLNMCSRVGAFRGFRQYHQRGYQEQLGRIVSAEHNYFPFTPLFFRMGDRYVMVQSCLPNVIGYWFVNQNRQQRCAEQRQVSAQGTQEEGIFARIGYSNFRIIQFNQHISVSDAIRFIWPEGAPFRHPLEPVTESGLGFAPGLYTQFVLSNNVQLIGGLAFSIESFLPGMRPELLTQYQARIASGPDPIHSVSTVPLEQRIPEWAHPEAREAILTSSFHSGVTVDVYPSSGDGWGRTVLRVSQGRVMRVEIYREYPEEISWYLNNIADGDHSIARINQEVYVQWNRDIASLVIERGWSLRRARDYLRGVYRELFMLIVAGFVGAFASGSMPGRSPATASSAMRGNRLRIRNVRSGARFNPQSIPVRRAPTISQHGQRTRRYFSNAA